MRLLELVCLMWVIITMLTSILHYFNIHKLDKYLCFKCITFWSILIFTQDIYTASVCAFIMYLFDKYDKKEIEL